MTVCFTADYLDLRSRYPVVDPRRTAGPGPYHYAYAFAHDGVEVTVERRPGPWACEMEVVLDWEWGLNKKGILAWNFHENTYVDYVGNRAGDKTSMVIRKEGIPGQACGTGTDTVVLGRWDPDPVGWQAQYYFPPQDFWDFWGGYQVTFNWITDRAGSGKWGSEAPQPTYPAVAEPDYTLIKEELTLADGSKDTSLFVVVGGATFPILEGEMGFSSASPSVIPGVPMPSPPADGTLVRQWDAAEVYVIYGGYPFWIPDPQTLYNLGFDWSQVREIPSGGLMQLQQQAMPIDGTLLKEQKGTPRLEGPRHDFLLPSGDVDPEVYLVDNQQLRHVTSTAAMEGNCLPWRHVRTVPEDSLAGLTPGPDFGP